jgi:hypothetical protein
MFLPLTFATLALLTVALVLLGVFWERVPFHLRFFLPRAALAIIILHALFIVTKWATTSSRLNVIINWLAVAGYELLIVLFARLPPRWLTSLSAAILIVPLFAASIVMPLTLIFNSGKIEKVPVAHNLYYKRVEWETGGNGTPGVDLEIYYRSPLFPFLSRKVQSQSFNKDQCDAFAATIQPGPDPETVLARCPHWPSQPPGNEDILLSLQ